MGGDVVSPIGPVPPTLREKLGFRRSKVFAFDGGEVLLSELTAGEAAAIWCALTDAETAGRDLDGYMEIVAAGARTAAGDKLFESVEEVRNLPARLVVPMAQTIMDLSDLGLESGKGEGDPPETLPTG